MYEQKDYLMKQIEELALVLGKILLKISALKSTNKISENHRIIKKSLLKDLDQDIGQLVNLEDHELNTIISNKFFDNPELLELYANILYEIAELSLNSVEKNKFLEKALFLYERTALKTNTFSFSLQTKINNIKKLTENK